MMHGTAMGYHAGKARCIMTDKPTQDDLTKRLDAPGWRLTGEAPDKSVTGTLGEVLTESHARKSRGRPAGRIAAAIGTAPRSS